MDVTKYHSLFMFYCQMYVTFRLFLFYISAAGRSIDTYTKPIKRKAPGKPSTKPRPPSTRELQLANEGMRELPVDCGEEEMFAVPYDRRYTRGTMTKV